MIYAKPFFDLQLDFAERIAAVAGLPFEQAVLDYTNLYIRFGFGREFSSSHPGWREYADGLRGAADRSAWTYRFYTVRSGAVEPPGLVATFGRFAYARLDRDRIRLHFLGGEEGGQSPLASGRRGQRTAELAALFADVKRRGEDTVRVVGASWLYNVEAYRALFPASYLATARPLRGRFRHMPLWGQFVNRRGEIREDAARELRARLRRLPHAEEADACFPSPLLSLEAPARDFCAFYGV